MEKRGLTAHDSLLLCKKNNGTLISIHSKKENDLISQYVNTSFIHLNGVLQFDSWMWLDGSGFDYSNWGGAEAEYVHGNTAPLGVCFVMMSGGLWRAGDCEEEAEQFVCRIGFGMSLLLTPKT